MFTRISIIAALLLAASTTAFAQDNRSVRYDALDLSKPAGIARLDHRIDRAVRQICGQASPTDLDSSSQVRRCRIATLASIAARKDALLASARPSQQGIGLASAH